MDTQETMQENSTRSDVDEPKEPQGEKSTSQEIDWKAQSRKWEARAKANQAKAEKLDKLEEESKSELQKAQEERDRLTKELETIKSEREHASLISRISQETGVPQELLHGETEDDILASANAINAYLEKTKPPYPKDKGGAANKKTMTRDEILAIKNPTERRRAIEANLGQFIKEE